MSHDPQTETTLNIPSILVFTILASFLIRYLFFSSAGSNAADRGFGTARRMPLDKIDTVATMFPQLNRRDIEWDLVRNGGSVQATTERVLRSGRLDHPPPNFVAQESPTAASTLSGASVSNTPTQPKTQHTDLITRYNLFSRINSVVGEMHDFDGADNAVSSDKQSGTTAGIAAQSKAWSANKVERQTLLKKRRDEMVLAARRKLLEKDQGGAPGERGPS